MIVFVVKINEKGDYKVFKQLKPFLFKGKWYDSWSHEIQGNKVVEIPWEDRRSLPYGLSTTELNHDLIKNLVNNLEVNQMDSFVIPN